MIGVGCTYWRAWILGHKVMWCDVHKWIQNFEDDGAVVKTLDQSVSVESLDKKSSENFTETIELKV